MTAEPTLAAGLIALIVGVVHSALGELLIFRRLRSSGIVPTLASQPLEERHVRIIWASWHVVTVFGWALGAVLLRMAQPSSEQSIEGFIAKVVFGSMLCASLLVLFATKGRHPGWIALLAVAVLAVA